MSPRPTQPTPFADLIGHQAVAEFMRRSINQQTVSHAYLVSGPSRVGKTTFVRQLVGSLICHQPISGLACQQCLACQQYQRGIHPDINWLTPAIDPKTSEQLSQISVEQVRELIGKLSQGTFLNGRKIGVIEPAESLSGGAANALLKTLEEPRPETVLILITNDEQRLPTTLVSRCQRLRLELVGRDVIADALMARGCQRHLASEIAQAAGGRPGRALDFYHQPEFWKDYQQVTQDFFTFCQIPTMRAMNGLLEAVTDDDHQQSEKQWWQERLDTWLSVLHDILLQGFASQAVLTPGDCQRFSERLFATQQAIRSNVNPKLAVENLLLTFIH